MMQHQYWVTKKTVLKKLGTKEDECIVSSDAELDAKLELFRSISDSCIQLQRVLDQYQDSICSLADEENSLGKFLRDTGKTADASGKHMLAAGKAISYSGQQRLSVRGPLVRLYHEVETFRGRAVRDMRSTVTAMEKARIEYRAALSWMKSSSQQLDPDTGRGVDSFRKAQRQVRESKKLFDKLTLDVLQKIDLLAAARCNMFSHVLANYQSSFFTFSTKVAQTLIATAETMNVAPQYEFCILKELSQNLEDGERDSEPVEPDRDQMLFFQDDFKDDDTKQETEESKLQDSKSGENLPKPSATTEKQPISDNLIDTSFETPESDTVNTDLVGLRMDCGDAPMNIGPFMPSQLLQDFNTIKLLESSQYPSPSRSADNPNLDDRPATKSKMTVKKDTGKDRAAWFKLFAELDPLANPDNIPGSNTNQSHAA